MSLSFSVKSMALSDAQKDEFLHKGTVTVLDENGHKKGHFEVRFMIGTDKITKDTQSAWHHAAELMSDLVKVEDFWHKEMVKSFFDGLNYASDCVSDGVCSIPKHFCDTVDRNAKCTGFGASAAKLRNWLEFCGQVCKDITVSAWGVVAGGAWAVVAPTAKLLYRPVVAGTEVVFGGMLWPAIAYSYTGAAYVMIKDSAEPKEGDISVTFVPNRFDEREIATNDAHLEL
jgi:hypothetical protein